jgi:thiol-disulfide isomerase/thioredoxin
MKGAKLDATIDLKDWTIDQPIPAEQFAFTAPPDAQKVDSMAEVFNGDQPAFKLKGKPAPEVSLDLLGGGKMSLAEHKGKDIVILDFWATWCGPCVEGLPIVSEVAKESAGKNVVFYGVNQQEEPAAIEAFVKEHKLDLKVALDKQGAAGNAFAVNGIPQTVIIGKDGIVKVVDVGIMPNFQERLKRDLEKVIADQK